MGRPQTFLDPKSALLAEMVKGAGTDVPVIESIEELAPRNLMGVPDPVKFARPELAYKWVGLDLVGQHKNGAFGVPYEIVTRTSHSRVPDDLFGNEGAIIYRGQLVLMFTRLQHREMLQRKTMCEFALKEENLEKQMTKQYFKNGKKAMATLEPIEKDPGDGYNEVPLTAESDYDYGDTGEE